MNFPSRETVERVRREYPAGTRVELVRMVDVQAPPVGTFGTVVGVDDTGSLLMRWDNGSGLNVVYGQDIVRKETEVVTVCYGHMDVWENRERAKDLFRFAAENSEGSEQRRYAEVYRKLEEGLNLCTDGEEW